MDRKIYIGSAWPYVNGGLHLGHIAGLLPADVLARYHRRQGDVVLWTSGSDCHGTPITERARAEGRLPREVASEYHDIVKRTFDRLGFSYSLYWATMESEHYTRVQESFRSLYERGFIVEGDYYHARCDRCQASRSDREVHGICPHCRQDARGDQCDSCGSELNPNELLVPVCAVCRQKIDFEMTRELFLDLPQFERQLSVWVSSQSHWRDNAKFSTLSWIQQGLKSRAITRQIDWGIPVPIAGWEDRRIYVWFEAVHGYWTASQQWALQNGDPDAWKPFWQQGTSEAIAYYVIGKDNIPFHTLMWPAMLMAHDLVLPHQIVSSEYLIFEDRKLSTSKGWVLWADEMLDRYDPDFIRYFLIASGPEKHDTNFTWDRFVTVTNTELVNNYGNLIQRVFAFVHKQFGGLVPPLKPAQGEEHLRAVVQDAFLDVARLLEQTELRCAIQRVMEVVQATNRYLNIQAPWNQIKTDSELASTTIAMALEVIAALSILTEPFMPFQAARLRTLLHVPESHGWTAPELVVGTQIGEITVFFQKIDPEMIMQEHARLERQLANT